LLQLVDPAKILFLNTSTNVLAGHDPDIATGEVLKCCPLLGDFIVAATVGGLPDTVPDSPIEPDVGPGTAGVPVAALAVNDVRTIPTTSRSENRGR
jgi:hypothetical protein